MSDEDFQDDDNDEYTDTKAVPSLRNHAKNLERDLAATKAELAEAAAAKRELNLIRAGVDLDSPTGKLFAKAYDGELDVDAIKEAAAEYGVIQAPATQASPEVLAQQRISQISQGAVEAPADFAGELANAQTPEEVMAIVTRAGIDTSYEQPSAAEQARLMGSA